MKKHYYFLITLIAATFSFTQAQQSCFADFYFTNSQGNLTVNFVDSSTFAPGAQPAYTWFFDSGSSSSSFQQNPTYTYSSPGTYLVTITVFDSLTSCFDSTSRYVTVPFQRPGNCNASFTKALDTTTAFGVLLTNTSSTSSSSAYTWYFGDGNSATGATPTHTYQSFGDYNVCLVVYDSLSRCVSTFCDTVGLDSNGRLKANGFGLRVDLPTVTSLEENTLENTVNFFPNPATDQLNIDLSKIDRAVNIRILNLSGQEVAAFNRIANQSNVVFDLSNQTKGLYILQIEDGVNSFSRKLVIK